MPIPGELPPTSSSTEGALQKAMADGLRQPPGASVGFKARLASVVSGAVMADVVEHAVQVLEAIPDTDQHGHEVPIGTAVAGVMLAAMVFTEAGKVAGAHLIAGVTRGHSKPRRSRRSAE